MEEKMPFVQGKRGQVTFILPQLISKKHFSNQFLIFLLTNCLVLQ